MSNTSTQVVGIPWFDSKQYGDVLGVMADADSLPRTHAEWLASATGLEEALKENGERVVRIPIEPHGFYAWCIYHGLDSDWTARQRYATHMINETDKRRAPVKFTP